MRVKTNLLETSTCFHHLLQWHDAGDVSLQGDSRLVNLLENISSVLDIGTRTSEALFPFVDLDAKEKKYLVGVDLDEEREVFNRIPELWGSGISSRYQHFRRMRSDYHLTKNQFYNSITFHNGKDIRTVDFKKKQFQLIIASNVLHYLKETTDVIDTLKRINQLLTESGYFYIRIREKVEQNALRKFSFDSYPELVKEGLQGRNYQMLRITEEVRKLAPAYLFHNFPIP